MHTKIAASQNEANQMKQSKKLNVGKNRSKRSPAPKSLEGIAERLDKTGGKSCSGKTTADSASKDNPVRQNEEM